jgi:hypothetical protein
MDAQVAIGESGKMSPHSSDSTQCPSPFILEVLSNELKIALPPLDCSVVKTFKQFCHSDCVNNNQLDMVVVSKLSAFPLHLAIPTCSL